MKIFSIVLLSFLCFLFSSCSSWDDNWELDGRFSYNLISGNADKSSDLVDIIQIYKIHTQKDIIPSLRILRRSPLFYEIQNKENIRSFFGLVQEEDFEPKLSEECFRLNREEVFHIVAFDHKIKRAAYFRYYLCADSDQFGVLKPLDDDGLFQNTKLLKFFREIEKNR